MLSNEAAWQQKAEEALKKVAADDSDSGWYKCCFDRTVEKLLLPVRTVLLPNEK